MRAFSTLFPALAVATAIGSGGCGNPTLVKGDGDGGTGGPGAPSGGGPGGAPSFNLPEAGATADGAGASAGGTDMACAVETHEAKQVPLDIVLLLDTSGSMYNLAGGAVGGMRQPKWTLTVNGLRSFLTDPKSAGLGLGLQFFPLNGDDRACKTDDDCNVGSVFAKPGDCAAKSVCTMNGQPVFKNRSCNPTALIPDEICPFGGTCTVLGRCANSGAPCYQIGQACAGGGGMCEGRGTHCRNIGVGSCLPADYEKLAVPIGELPAVEPAVSAAIDAKEPIGDTPTTFALVGVFNHLRQHLTAHPDRRAAVVLFTDGLPFGSCADNSEATARLAILGAQTGTPSISTYVIGVFDNNQPNASLDTWARVGGTGAATLLTPTENLSQKFLDTLNQIRGRALACDFTIPPQTGALDYGKVNVRVTGAAGGQELLYVTSVDRCDPANGGWYYDVNPATGKPTRVIVCPATCEQFKNGTAGKLDLLFGCATRVIQ